MREKGLIIKEFRKKVAEEKENITDKDFFLSEACGVYLQNLATAITKEYSTGTDLHIQWTDDSIVAYATDRGQITINLNNEFMASSSTRIEKLVAQKLSAEKACFCGRELQLINYIPAWICL